MSKTIHRYYLPIKPGRHNLELPVVCKPLTIRKDNSNLPYLCMIVDTDSAMIDKTILIIQEGQSERSLTCNRQYYGCFAVGGVNYYVFDGGA